MNGNFVFKNAVIRFEEVIFEALNYSNLKPEDISSNSTPGEFENFSIYTEEISLDDDQVFNNNMKYGNTTAASIPIALKEAIDNKKLKKVIYYVLQHLEVVLRGLLH